jgi:hypothetical protein
MRRYSRSFTLAVLFPALLGLAACGGGGNKSGTAPASIGTSPASLSLTAGGVASITAVVLDGNGSIVLGANIAFASSDTSIATVSSTGLVCAGTWDANNIVCTPGPTGNTQINITSGSLSATVPVYTHGRVDDVRVSPATVDCRSAGQTQQLTAQAFSNGVDITSLVGPFTWTSTAPVTASVDGNGVVTAQQPGTTQIFASVSNVASVPATFVTCGVKKIDIHVSSGADTSFSLSAGGTQQLTADVIDTAGNSISPSLLWIGLQPASATVNNVGLVTAVAAGTAGVVAACSPPCNAGSTTIYSNVALASVSGSSSTTVYATGTGVTSLVPIDTSTNTAGTAITLPGTPNSFIFDRQGVTGYLGSNSGLIVLDTGSNTITSNTGAPGKVLAVSPDGTRVVVAGSGAVYLVTSGAVQALSITGATAADFSPDNRKAFIVAGSNLYVYQAGAALLTLPVSAAAPDVSLLASGAFAYLAGGAASAVTARATCDASLADTAATAGSPALLKPLPDGSGMVAADSPGLDVITATTDRAGCPPSLSDAVSFQDFGQGAFVAKQLLVLPSGNKVYLLSDLAKLLVYDVTGKTVSTIALAGGATPLSGGSTLDSATLYVGGSDNTVHRIDVASGTDAQQISVSFTPDLVAVRPK